MQNDVSEQRLFGYWKRKKRWKTGRDYQKWGVGLIINWLYGFPVWLIQISLRNLVRLCFYHKRKIKQASNNFTGIV